jgi:hypothetical protein
LEKNVERMIEWITKLALYYKTTEKEMEIVPEINERLIFG